MLVNILYNIFFFVIYLASVPFRFALTVINLIIFVIILFIDLNLKEWPNRRWQLKTIWRLPEFKKVK